MLHRHRFTCVGTLACALLAHPLAATATVNSVDSSVTAVHGTTDSAAAAPGTAPPPPPTPDLGTGVVSCRMGAGLAAENPSFLSGAGIAMCLIGIVMEIDDFLNSHGH